MWDEESHVQARVLHPKAANCHHHRLSGNGTLAMTQTRRISSLKAIKREIRDGAADTNLQVLAIISVAVERWRTPEAVGGVG